MVHRDRDSLTDEEVATLGAQYTAAGVVLWCPQESDIEAYFCQIPFLETFLACPQVTAQAYLADALANQAATIGAQFVAQRAAHNQELYKDGGSPTNADVWAQFQQRPLMGAKGKTVFNRLKNAIPANAFRSESIALANLGGTVALDFKHAIEAYLAN
jgi:hypothetical protein